MTQYSVYVHEEIVQRLQARTHYTRERQTTTIYKKLPTNVKWSSLPIWKALVQTDKYDIIDNRPEHLKLYDKRWVDQYGKGKRTYRIRLRIPDIVEFHALELCAKHDVNILRIPVRYHHDIMSNIYSQLIEAYAYRFITVREKEPLENEQAS